MRLLSDPRRTVPHPVLFQSQPNLFAGRRLLSVPADWPPTLLVVIDTEEEFDWRALPNPASRSVTNIQAVPLLQAVFDRFAVEPAYLVDHPVAAAPDAVAVLRTIAQSGRCEIGAHLHPWVTPPVEETISARHAFACNLPPSLERRKLHTLTAAITAAFGTPPIIFKAGSYGIGPQTAGFLAELGYKVDSSLVPFTNFTRHGGPNFQEWTCQPFETIEGIVELPLSAGFAGRFSAAGQRLFPKLERPVGRRLHLPGVAARLALLERLRLSPEGHTLTEMVRLTAAARARGQQLFMLTLHSSALLPGATSYVRTPAERDAFLKRIEDYLRYFHETIGGRSSRVSAIAATLAALPRPSPAPQAGR